MSNLGFAERIIINEYKQRNKWICYYCNKEIVNKADLTVDHRNPLSRGGVTEEANLAISCVKCNREKDNMTEIEYSLYKNRKLEIYESLSFVNIVKELFSAYDNLIKHAQRVNLEYASVEKRVQSIVDEIANKNFNAYDGYLLAKELKETIKSRNQMKVVKDAYNALHSLIGNSKKNLQEVNEKIMNDLITSQYKELKAACIEAIKSCNLATTNKNPSNCTIFELG